VPLVANWNLRRNNTRVALTGKVPLSFLSHRVT
jgi:hypothetical protein